MKNSDLIITESNTVKEALKKLDNTAQKTLVVTAADGMYLGSLTDGDVRRHLLKGGELNESIVSVFNRHSIVVHDGEYAFEAVKEMFLKQRISVVPVIGKDGMLSDTITWEDVFADTASNEHNHLPITTPVVIMAGGKGSRMDPFTKILPKALIPIGEKTVLEMIIDGFRKFGISNFFLTLNFKGQMIEAYLNSIEKEYRTFSIWEKEFLGTAGSLSLIKSSINETFIVSNCDIVVNAAYNEVIAFHKEHKADITILSSVQHHTVPYGVISFVKNGEVTEIIEKPEHSFIVNTGVYVIEPASLNYLEDGKVCDMPTLIQRLIKDKKRVYTYPVNEHDYVDLGQLDEYKKVVEKLRF